MTRALMTGAAALMFSAACTAETAEDTASADAEAQAPAPTFNLSGPQTGQTSASTGQFRLGPPASTGGANGGFNLAIPSVTEPAALPDVGGLPIEPGPTPAPPQDDVIRLDPAD